MATNNRWRFYQLQVDEVVIPAIGSPVFRPGIEQFLEGGEGSIDRTFAGTKSVKPELEFDTFALATALSKVGLHGFRVQPAAEVILWYAKCDRIGILSGNQHLKIVLNNGLIVPTTLRANQFDHAALHYMVHTEYDGTNNPYTVQTNQALPTQLINDEIFTLGPASINGSNLLGLQSCDINFGTVVTATGDDGHLYNTFTGITDRQTTVNLQILDLLNLSSLGIAGAAQSTTDSVLYFRKRTKEGGLVPNGTAEHIKLVIDAGHIIPGEISESDGRSALAVAMQLAWDGTNDVLVINTASSIT